MFSANHDRILRPKYLLALLLGLPLRCSGLRGFLLFLCLLPIDHLDSSLHSLHLQLPPPLAIFEHQERPKHE